MRNLDLQNPTKTAALRVSKKVKRWKLWRCLLFPHNRRYAIWGKFWLSISFAARIDIKLHSHIPRASVNYSFSNLGLLYTAPQLKSTVSSRWSSHTSEPWSWPSGLAKEACHWGSKWECSPAPPYHLFWTALKIHLNLALTFFDSISKLFVECKMCFNDQLIRCFGEEGQKVEWNLNVNSNLCVFLDFLISLLGLAVSL